MNSIVIIQLYTLKPFDNHWNIYLNAVEQERCKAICFIAEHFSFVGNFDLPGNKSLIDFFNNCKEKQIAVVIVKNPFITSEYRNYYIAQQISQYGGIPIVGTFGCMLIKMRWLLGQGTEYKELHSRLLYLREMKKVKFSTASQTRIY